jgi:hypothetical protein
MGRFRSLFDADEMRDLAVAAGLVDEAAAAPESAEPVVRRSLLLDDDDEPKGSAAVHRSAPRADENAAANDPADSDERVRLLLQDYLAGGAQAAAPDADVQSDVVDTPLPAIVMEDDDVPLVVPPEALWRESSGSGLDASTRAFLATPSAVLGVVADAMTTSGVGAADVMAEDSPNLRSELPWGAAADDLAAVSANPSFGVPADSIVSGAEAVVGDTPFEEGHSRTVVSAVTEPTPLPGQHMLMRLSRPPLFTLLRASLIARVPWRVWQQEPWTQPHLCAALAAVTGESEQFFAQEDAWRN